MTTYSRTDRYYWRTHLRWLARRITLALAVLTLLLVLLPAQAQAKTCPARYNVPIAHGMRSADGTGVCCDSGYQGTFRRTGNGWTGRCVAGPVVRGGQP